MWLDLPPPDPAIEIVIASQGMSKGLRQTEGPQVLVRPSLSVGTLSLGAYAKNITAPSADGEAGVYLGYAARLGSLQLTPVITYKRLVSPRGHADAGAWEFGLSLSRPVGQITPYLSLYYTPDELGSTGESLFAEAGASLRLSPSLSISASLARRARAAAPDYHALSAGFSYRIVPQVSVELRFHDTDRGALGEAYQRRFVATLSARF
jgi:hypothetical protein